MRRISFTRVGGISAVVALAVLVLTASSPAAAGAPLTQQQAEAIGLDAYDYGIPLMEFLRQAREQTSVTVPNAVADAPINQLGNARMLTNAAHQPIVQPNNDTLYTMGHLDLRAGPLVLHVPGIAGHRYYSFEFLDPYTNVFHYIGTRTTGDGAGTFLIGGPSFHGRTPRGMRLIRSPYELAWAVGRTLVDGPSDLAAAHRVQDGYRLIPLADYRRGGLRWRPSRPKRIVTKPSHLTEPTGLAFFDQLGTALAKNPPPARDRAILAELRTVGLGPGLHPSSEHLSAPVIAGLTAAANDGAAHVAALKLSIAAGSARAHDGWFVPPADTGDYGTDYAFRAVVALNGIAANRPVEAMYIIGVTDSTHALLNGADDYAIHFPAGELPPARYFWSLTMYDKNFYLVANPLNRYELASHSAGLKRNPDGSLDIYLQHMPPPGHWSNWLPTPASGQFEVTLRLYGPKGGALAGRYAYPPIMRTAG
ncbi:MAG TPA: DUF1254 domain-containing protein [Solirubrobacteraceae bacterium]